MSREILDDGFENEIKQANFINWIPIILLWIGIAYCGKNGLLGEPKVIAAIVLLTISTVLTFNNYNIGVKFTLFVIVIGIFNIISFFPIQYFLRLGFAFQLIPFAIGIIHYLSNRKSLSFLFDRTITEEEIKSAERSKVKGFKGRFSKKNIDELEKIANNDRLVPQARKAAYELIKEKKKIE